MSELTIYKQISDPVSAIATIGKSIAQSQIFGCQNEAQGQVIALECMVRGLPPLSLAEQYHLFQGKLSMKSDAMLDGFEKAGGEYEIKEYSSEVCEIIFKRGKHKLAIRITWEDAQKEPWPYGKESKLKPTWATPIGRQDMLWARVVSRGVRRLAPGVVCGRYTPEEIQDFDSQPVAVASAPEKPKTQEQPLVDPEVIEAEFQAVSSVVETDELPPLMKPQPGDQASRKSLDEPCGVEYAEQIKSEAAFIEQQGVKVAVKLKAMLAKIGLSKLAELPISDAQRLLVALQRKEIDEFFAGNFEPGKQ